jgi:hypothetical protein
VLDVGFAQAHRRNCSAGHAAHFLRPRLPLPRSVRKSFNTNCQYMRRLAIGPPKKVQITWRASRRRQGLRPLGPRCRGDGRSMTQRFLPLLTSKQSDPRPDNDGSSTGLQHRMKKGVALAIFAFRGSANLSITSFASGTLLYSRQSKTRQS